MKVGVYLDERTISESTSLIMEALAKRGHQVLYFSGQLHQGVSQPVLMNPYQGKKPQETQLTDLDCLVLRKDPPVDQRTYNGLCTLESQVRMINPPSLIRRDDRKFMAQPFLQPYTPRTFFPAYEQEVRERIRQLGKVVIKPIDGFGGQGMFCLDRATYDSTKVEEAISRGPIVVQEYLPEADAGDKRIIVINGEIVGAVHRPPPGCSPHQGKATPTPVTSREAEIVGRIWPALAQQGMVYAGLDFIDEKLTEINLTSPALFGPFWKALYPARAAPEELLAECISKTT